MEKLCRIIADAAFQSRVNASGAVLRSNHVGIVDRLFHDQREFIVTLDNIDPFLAGVWGGALLSVTTIDEREAFAVADRLRSVDPAVRRGDLLHAPAEEHQLLRQVRPAHDGVLERLEVFPHAVGANDLADALGAAADHAEEVVEIVRDAAGEDAHRLHLLGVTELSLE